jgi:hypothetical protein
VRLDEIIVSPAISEQVLERAVQERDVAADVDVEEAIGDLRAEQRTLG